MKKINYKTDFREVLHFYECNYSADGTCVKRDIGFPTYDFEVRFYTWSRANAYVASYKDGVMTNCINDGDRCVIVFDNLNLGTGQLKYDVITYLPDATYPDGSRRGVEPYMSDIELVDGHTDCPTTAELETMLPFIKGEPFTFDDFTPEQIAELQKPATEAAAELRSLTTRAAQAAGDAEREAETARQINSDVATAESERVKAEHQREEAELLRNSAETKRDTDEHLRQSAEQTRVADETSRVSAEQARVSAETKRDAAERERVTAETSRKGAEEVRVKSEQARVDAEALRANAEKRRVEAETERVDEFATIKRDAETATSSANTAASNANTAANTAKDVADSMRAEIEEAKRKVFIDLWNDACGIWGKYNAESGFFELNGFTDISYEEALKIYNAGPIPMHYAEYVYASMDIRTNLPSPGRLRGPGDNMDLRLALSSSKIEVLNLFPNFADYTGKSYSYSVQLAPYDRSLDSAYLKKIIGGVSFDTVKGGVATLNIAKLEDVKFFLHRNQNISLPQSSVLSAESVRFMVTNASNTDTITLTFHADVYAKILADEGEWQGILDLAQEKNISIASA